MADLVEFECHSNLCKDAIKAKSLQWLHECGQIIIKEVLSNYRVKTGQTKNSFHYYVSEKGNGELSCTIGSPNENAIWEEFGTGIYAKNGDGRKTGWKYIDEKGKEHWTRGKKPSEKSFRSSFDKNKRKLQDRFADLMKGLK